MVWRWGSQPIIWKFFSLKLPENDTIGLGALEAALDTQMDFTSFKIKTLNCLTRVFISVRTKEGWDHLLFGQFLPKTAWKFGSRGRPRRPSRSANGINLSWRKLTCLMTPAPWWVPWRRCRGSWRGSCGWTSSRWAGGWPGGAPPLRPPPWGGTETRGAGLPPGPPSPGWASPPAAPPPPGRTYNTQYSRYNTRDEPQSSYRVHHLQGEPRHQQHHHHRVEPTTHSTAGIILEMNHRAPTVSTISRVSCATSSTTTTG